MINYTSANHLLLSESWLEHWLLRYSQIRGGGRGASPNTRFLTSEISLAQRTCTTKKFPVGARMDGVSVILFIDTSRFTFWLKSFYLLSSHFKYWLLVSRVNCNPRRLEHFGRASATPSARTFGRIKPLESVKWNRESINEMTRVNKKITWVNK